MEKIESEEKLNLSWLLPDIFNYINLQPNEKLSIFFVAVLLIITVVFAVMFAWSYRKASKRVTWFNTVLKKISSGNIAFERRYIKKKAQRETKVDDVGHLWLEFDETLIEVRKNGEIQLFNTLDAIHFFNTSTLARGVTDDRLIAAVPGFLTAVGVIGTFVGLQIGMSGMDMTGDVDKMKDGVKTVIDGAKIAFMTSIWGVSLSVLFNAGEKSFEQRIRTRISTLQAKIDDIFPRLNAESQLQVIADNSDESRESLQGLAEQIGTKMQESMLTATAGISEALTNTLNEIMAPAINKLVDTTTEGNQRALEDLLKKFMDGFGAQGSQQRVAMDDASDKVNESIAGMNTAMEAFVQKIEVSQRASGEREKELMSSVSLQVSQLVDQSNEQGRKMTDLMETQLGNLSKTFENSQISASKRDKELANNISEQITLLIDGISAQSNVLTDFVSNQMSSLNSTFEAREAQTAQQAQQRDVALAEQTKAISLSTKDLVSKIESSIKNHQSSSEQVLQQGKLLQGSVEASVLASAKATDSMRESASELKLAAESMNVFGSHVRDAGNKLSGAVTEAVETTKDLAAQNQMSSERMEILRGQLLEDTGKFKDIADQINMMIVNVDNTFDTLKSTQSEYLKSLKQNVTELSIQMTKLLTEYAEQANSQTSSHLKIWSESTTVYATQMNNAVMALSSVVDEIQNKVGSSNENK